MVLLPHIEKPFQWANASTWKTHLLGICVAFWVSFTLLGTNLLVAEKVGVEVASGALLFFFLFGAFFAGFSGLLARTMSRKTVLVVGLVLMVLGTIAINVVNSFGLFALSYILMAAGFAPAISVIGHLNHDFLGDDEESLSKGRSSWGTLNYVSAACTASAILLVNHGYQQVWFVISMLTLLVAASMVRFIKEELAIKEQPFMEPDEGRLPFYPQLLTKDKSVRFSWQYVLVIAGSLAVRFWPVFYMNEWVAVAMIFCGELANGLCGPLQVKLSQKLRAKKNKAIQRRIVRNVSQGTLVANFIALLLIAIGYQTNDAKLSMTLCIIGAVMIGVAVRVFTYLDIPLSEQQGRGTYTFFFMTAIGQGLGCVVHMSTMTMLGMLSLLMMFTLGGIAYYNWDRLRNLIFIRIRLNKS